jgi:O-antigen/teichoic acid export membrane protein
VSVKRNIIANFAGSGWLALMGLAFIPLYIHFMGVESFGIVGVLVSLQAFFALLDLGLSQTLARELARLSVEPRNASRMADTARTFEIIYWSLALLIAATIALLAHFIAYYWLNPDNLGPESLREAIWIIAVVVALRAPLALYMGGLNGLQRQVLVNTFLATFATIQAVGAVAVLWLVAPTVQVFLLWQALIALLQVVAFRSALWRNLSPEGHGKFSIKVLQGTWRFAGGITGISILITLLTQLDKLLLSRLLSLTDFGYYVFAATVAATLYRLITPVSIAYSPLLAALAFKNEHQAIARTYHQGCQIMAVVILAPTLTLAFFSREILELWTQNPDLVSGTYLLVSLLVIGNALNGLVTIPYALQLAHGWTRLAFYQNLIAVFILVPAVYFATLRWGAVGAASVWVVLNSSYVLISMHVMHRRLLKAEKWRWYAADVAKPLLGVLFVVGIGRMVMADEWSGWLKLAALVIVLATAIAAAALGADSLRARLAPRLSSAP